LGLCTSNCGLVISKLELSNLCRMGTPSLWLRRTSMLSLKNNSNLNASLLERPKSSSDSSGPLATFLIFIPSTTSHFLSSQSLFQKYQLLLGCKNKCLSCIGHLGWYRSTNCLLANLFLLLHLPIGS